MELRIRVQEGSAAEAPVEVVERKGLGHPDTLCDAVAEHVSASLCRAYLGRFGTILHHNVDKVLLAAGGSRPAFGGGELTHPIGLYLGGRATADFGGAKVPVDDIAVEAARECMRQRLPYLDPQRDLRVVSLIHPGSIDLARLFARAQGEQAPRANDTSVGAGFAPFTPLERAVLAAERALNAPETKRAHPEIGADIKVMGIRHADRLHLTVSCAFIGRHVADLADYLAKKAGVAALAGAAAGDASGLDTAVEVNAGDDLDRGDVYLTVTGTSAEAGDDGEVGRGNRANGLITPYRPMTLEAAAGKNPVNHVGKLYGVMAGRIAAGLAEALGERSGVECLMLSQIGRPIDDPALVDLRVSGLSRGREEAVAREVVRHELARLTELRDELVREAIVPF